MPITFADTYMGLNYLSLAYNVITETVMYSSRIKNDLQASIIKNLNSDTLIQINQFVEYINSSDFAKALEKLGTTPANFGFLSSGALAGNFFYEGKIAASLLSLLVTAAFTKDNIKDLGLIGVGFAADIIARGVISRLFPENKKNSQFIHKTDRQILEKNSLLLDTIKDQQNKIFIDIETLKNQLNPLPEVEGN